MAQITHDVDLPNTGNGDPLRTAFVHQNQMNTELYETKVDKVIGKDLSSNDYTNLEKAKLAGIEAGAQVNVPINYGDIIGAPIFNNIAAYPETKYNYIDSNTFTIPENVQAITVRKNGDSTDNIEDWTQLGDEITYLGTLTTGDYLIIGGVFVIPSGGGGTPSDLITKFTSNPVPTIVGTDITIPANETWLIDSILHTNSIVSTIQFSYAPTGLLYFLSVVATTANTFIGKFGTASSDPSEPIVNNDELFLTTYLISDGSVDIIVPPVTSNIYVEKESYYPFIYNSGVAVIGSIGMDKRCNLVLGGSITKIGNVIKNNPNHFVLGQYFLTTNKTGGDIEVEHLNTVGGSDVISYFNPEETSYILKNNEVAVWISELLGGQKIHRRATTYIDRDNLVYRSGTEVGKPIFGDLEMNGDGDELIIFNGNNPFLETKNGIVFTDDGLVGLKSKAGSDISLFLNSLSYFYISGNFAGFKGIVGNALFNKASDPKAFIQLGDIAQLESDVFDLGIENTGDETTASIQSKRPLKTINGNSLEGSGDLVISGGGGAVDSVNGQTGIVVLDADDIDETATRVYVTPTEKTAITHSNRSVLDNITEAFTTALKTAYDGAVSHLSRTDNPHSVTKTQVGLSNVDNTSDVSKPISTATQSALDAKQDTLTDTNFGTFTNSVANKNTQADTDILAYVDVTTGKWVKQTFSKLVDYLKGYFQTSRIIVTSNITAVNGSVYHNNGTVIYTDPTGVAGMGYYVYVAFGTATIGTTTYAKGSYIFRVYDGTSWNTEIIKNGIGQKIITGNVTLNNTYHNCIVLVKNTATITVPYGLTISFNCVFDTWAGATATFVQGTNVDVIETALILSPLKMASLYQDSSSKGLTIEVYKLKGETS